jgi:hypothetical protein
VAVFFCGCARTVSTPIAVEYWHTGDDGLSQKLQLAVETAFRQSADFRLTPVDTGGRRLVVWNMRNVEGELVGERTKATCTVKFSSLDDNTSRNPNLEQRFALAREISIRRVSCWDSEMANCAAQIVREAKIAAREVQQ